MAKSFADSLNALTATQPQTMSLRNAVALAAEEETWTLHTEYEHTNKDNIGYHYVDENISYVDDKKNIKVNEFQVNITQETNSQYMPFIMNRYYDGIDLVNMKLSFYFENAEGGWGERKAVNVEYNDTKIKLGFLVPKEATLIAGKLKFEIHAVGASPLGGDYVLKTKPNDDIEIIESLQGNGNYIVAPDYAENVVEEVRQEVAKAESAAAQAQSLIAQANSFNTNTTNTVNAAIEEINTKIATVEVTIKENVIEELSIQYYTKDETNSAISSAIQPLSDNIGSLDNRVTKVEGDILSISDNLDNYYKKTETLNKEEIEQAIADIDVTTQLSTLEGKIAEEYYNKEQIEKKLEDIDVSDQLENYYTKDVSDGKYAPKSVETTVNNQVAEIKTINSSITAINEELSTIDKSPKTKYRATYGDVELDDGSTANYMFTLWREENGVEEVQDRFQIAGGGGGSSSSVSMKIAYVEDCPQYPVYTINDSVIIKYLYEGIDSAGDYVGGTASWKIGNKVILKEEISSGENSADLTNYVGVGDTKVSLVVTHESGSTASKTWTIKVVDLTIKSSFDNTQYYTANTDVEFNFIATGSVEKTVHFVLDGEEIGTKINSAAASGRTDYFVLPAQNHGSHLLDVYMTADINGESVPSNHLYKDIVWFNSSSTIPVIGCDTPVIEMTQYNSVNIKYTVFDSSTETPEVTWYVNDEIVSVETLKEKDEKGFYTYSYKANEHGTFELKVVCGESDPKIITVNVAELDIDVSPVLSGLAFDFNPIGYSNSSTDRIWSDGDVTMTLSDNFDWVNGGYQIDDNGDKYFCVKAGTNAVINYNLFNDAAQTNGKEFKIVFKTKNIRQRNTSFLTCMNDGIGLDMKVEHASVHCSGGTLKSLYCEDEIIEYEFNINKSSDMMIAMTYEDGTPNIPYEYTETTSFRQTSAQPITIGSEDCDVHIYRMKAYKTSLTDEDIKNNFIADARNADEMIARYNRNQIYNEDGKVVSTLANGDFNADALMKSNPQLRYIFLEVPYFTNHKDDKIDGCSVYYRYPAGTRPEDNWDCTGMRHRGQGTSSNEYGPSGRNVDLVMDRKTSKFTWTDENGDIVESSTITITDTSYPTDYLNIKVNVASSENANNAQLARRFNEYQPFLRYIRKKDSRVKDTMEFYNCVLFIRETNEDLTTHREFADCNWHFYAIGNVGSSKKTDDTRVNNANDPKEFVVELMDVDKPLSSFPTGKANNETCPVSEWKAGNTAYDVLYSTDYVYDDEGKFESFAGTTFEFRYEMDGITEEQRETNINVWRDFYKFLATSTDEEIYANLKKYFVVDSALYYYLFTERYTMVDNRSKNSFWHYGKVYITTEEATQLGTEEASYYIIDNEMAEFNNGYRFDLTFGYDMDTSLGIDNTGDLVFPYGKEDVDFYDDTNSKEVFRVSNSRFFCKIRDLFAKELEAMYTNRESAQAWNAESLIKQWDDAQGQFPEEIWRLDYERKYRRPYLGTSVDNSILMGVDKGYLIGKFFGRKKYQRRMYERNQEVYFATKYFANKAKNDRIYFRGNVAPAGATIKQNYSLTITPYSDMYVCVQYTSTGTPIHKRMKAGETYTFVNNATSMDFMYIYAAGYIQEIGDLSRCYIDDNSFTNGIRLRRLTIGSSKSGYDNPYMTKLAADNNPLLEYLDLRKISGLNSDLNLISCGNLKELYAEGTNTTGAIFANGGLLEIAHLPAVNSLLMKNLNHLTDLQIAGYNNLKSLTIENCPTINSYNIVNSSVNLQELRLIGINWDSSYNITDSSILDRTLKMWGRDGSNNPVDTAVLTGYIYTAVIKEKDLENYEKLWSDLDIEYGSMKKQFPAVFKNADGKILEIQYVEMGQVPEDPVTRENNPIERPSIVPTVSHEFTYVGWDRAFTKIESEQIYTAVYEPVLRNYEVKYFVNGKQYGDTVTALYGSVAECTNTAIPTYTDEESAYKFSLFTGWDKSGYVDGNKTINAVFDTITYSAGYFDNLSFDKMSPVEKYAFIKLGFASNAYSYIGTEAPFSFNMGNDYDFEDVESQVFIDKETEFNGSNYIDTGVAIMDIDRSFVFAIDYEFNSTSTNNSALMHCYFPFNSEGFKLTYSSSNPRVYWGNESTQCATGDNREMLVIRHTAGETIAHVYMSNLSDLEIGYIELDRGREMTVSSTLTFGCVKQTDGYESFAKGKIYWAKVWYSDLGDTVCRSIASYTREKISSMMAGFQRKYLADGSGSRSSLTFLATHPLRTTHVLKKGVDFNAANVGGFGSTDVKHWLNTRFYNGTPLWMKQLIKQVKVNYSSGGGVNSISTTDCYFYLPAIIELTNTILDEPYYSEETASERTIPYMVDPEDRIVRNHTNTAVIYPTRSAIAANSKYYYGINASGAIHTTISPTSEWHLVIEWCM